MLKTLYLFFIHALVVFFVLKSSTIQMFFKDRPTFSSHYLQMTAFHQRIDKNLEPDLNIFIGDSFIQGLAVSSVNENSVNYGIGGDTTEGVMQRLPLYHSIAKSKRVILAIGHNDLSTNNSVNSVDNLKMIFNTIPADVHVIFCSIFLVDESIVEGVTNSKITELNYKINHLIRSYSNVTYINTNKWAAPRGSLRSSLHLGDGLHLNQRGNALWIKQLKEVFERDFTKEKKDI